MKVIAIAAAVAAFVGMGTAFADWTPAGVACITKQGYQLSNWQARTVPEGPAIRIRACLAKVKAAKEKKGL
jgi:hypothetical protein